MTAIVLPSYESTANPGATSIPHNTFRIPHFRILPTPSASLRRRLFSVRQSSKKSVVTISLLRRRNFSASLKSPAPCSPQHLSSSVFY